VSRSSDPRDISTIEDSSLSKVTHESPSTLRHPECRAFARALSTLDLPLSSTYLTTAIGQCRSRILPIASFVMGRCVTECGGMILALLRFHMRASIARDTYAHVCNPWLEACVSAGERVSRVMLSFSLRSLLFHLSFMSESLNEYARSITGEHYRVNVHAKT